MMGPLEFPTSRRSDAAIAGVAGDQQGGWRPLLGSGAGPIWASQRLEPSGFTACITQVISMM